VQCTRGGLDFGAETAAHENFGRPIVRFSRPAAYISSETHAKREVQHHVYRPQDVTRALPQPGQGAGSESDPERRPEPPFENSETRAASSAARAPV
jgi:hypothetical protein